MEPAADYQHSVTSALELLRRGARLAIQAAWDNGDPVVGWNCEHNCVEYIWPNWEKVSLESPFPELLRQSLPADHPAVLDLED